jgi:uncharacterized protein (DUF1778 family)
MRFAVPEPKPKPKKVGRPKLPKGAAKSSSVNLRFNAEYRKRIDAAAKAKKVTVSEWMRSVIDAALAQEL